MLKLAATDFRMWYEAVGPNIYTQVGYATSSDGITIAISIRGDFAFDVSARATLAMHASARTKRVFVMAV